MQDLESSASLFAASLDLLIVNHYSLLILPSKNPSYYSEKWKQTIETMKPSSFVLINTRDSLLQLEQSLAQTLISDMDELESFESLESHMLSHG